MSLSVITSEGPSAFIQKAVQIINSELSRGGTVVLFLSGGSLIPHEVAIVGQLKPPSAERLLLMQVDERYGRLGHADSNWQKLLTAHLETVGLTFEPVLTGGDFASTIERYNEITEKRLAQATLSIGLLGIGADGHTAGILPHSVATVARDRLVVGYQGPDFQRITLSLPAIEQLDVALVYVDAQEKAAALRNLQMDISVDEQPAQVLKHVKETYIYSNHIKGQKESL